MEKLIIEGGVPLHGRVEVGSAKNSVLPLMAATMLAPGIHQFYNIPILRDVFTMQKLLNHLGVHSQTEGKNLTLTTDGLQVHEAPYELVKTMRASVLVLGPMLARWGISRVSLPGGCAIGARPIDLHIKALEQMGATITIEEGFVVAKAERLRGAEIQFDIVTVTGTENIMMAACLAEGTTVLKNAAREPEVSDLAHYLIKMGARIEGVGTETITIRGVTELKPSSHQPISDRIEAVTFLIAGAITHGEITVENCPTDFLGGVLKHLRDAGCQLTIHPQNNSLVTLSVPNGFHSLDLTTAPYPGLATDLQAQLMALMTLAKGTSTITETVFENRFQHALELNRLGANIKIEGNKAVVEGVEKLSGAPLMATDLRASASLILAGLAAQGTTVIDRAYHIDRGYEKIEEKFSRLGARIRRQG